VEFGALIAISEKDAIAINLNHLNSLPVRDKKPGWIEKY
jgi:hypothetical protein